MYMKKICFLLGHYFDFCKGGAELQANIIATELAKDFYIDYIFVKPPGFNATQIQEIDTKFTLHTLGNHDFRIFGKCYFLNYYELMKLLNHINPNVIYIRGDRAHLGIAAKWCKKHKKPLIFGISMDKNCSKRSILSLDKNFLAYPTKALNSFFTFTGIRNADIVIAQTNKQKKLIRNHFHRDSIVIPNGLPIPPPPFIKEKPPIISWIANIKPIKQLELFLQLATAFKQSNIKFISAGRPCGGSYQKLLNKKIKKTPNLTYLGEVSYDQTNALLSKSSILVNTSSTEGFSNTYIQAWMRQTPVVTLNCDPDNVIKNENIGFHSGNLKQLVDDVRFLIQNEKIRQIMGENARKYAIKNYNMEKIIKQYFDIFKRLTE